MAKPPAHSYETLLGGSLEDGACVTWVRGLDPHEVLRRLGAPAPIVERTIEEVETVLDDPFGLTDAEGKSLEPIIAVCDRLDATWTLLVEPNGWAGTLAADLVELSAGTEAVSIFWNINALVDVCVARDRGTRALIADLIAFVANGEAIQGAEPHLFDDLVAPLAEMDEYEWKPIAFAWAERYTGARLPASWMRARHPSAAFGKRRDR